MRPVVLALGSLLLLSAVGSAADPVDYRRDVRPVLQERCYACHGAIQQKAKLRVDSGAALVRSGVVVPGKPGESELIARVASKDDATRMPPEGHSLTDKQIATLKAWIEQGAAVPADDKPEPDPRDHWAFRTPVRPPVPQAGTFPARNPIDNFVAAEWTRHGLKPQSFADKRVLLRRVYLDLIGLPPTSEQADAFLKDTSPDAYEKVVDQLLASPQYGERWGRHFLDVWRYSDWWGLGAELRNSQKHIWHWRDWTVESVNADVGYNEMLRQMLAADELYPTDAKKLRATGYLARPYFLFNRTTWLDEVIEHSGKGFLGLTTNCAKCHDHKYDPFTQANFYQLRAIFEPYQVRTDFMPGELDPEKGGLPRAFDCNPDVKTPFHIRGDERNPDPNREIRPGLPGFLAPNGLKIEPVKLPLLAYQPGARPEIAAAYRKQAEEKLAAAEGDVRKAKAAVEEAVKLAAKELLPAPANPGPANPAAGKPVLKDDFAKPNPDVWVTGSGMWKHDRGRLLQLKPDGDRSWVRTKTAIPTDFQAKFDFVITGGTPYRSVGLSFDVNPETETLVYVSAMDGGPKVQVAYKQNGQYQYPADGMLAMPIPVGKPIEMTVRARGPLVNVAIDGKHALAYRLPLPRKDGQVDLITYTATAEFTGFELRELGKDVDLLEPGGKIVAKSVVTPELAEANLRAADQLVAAAKADLAAVNARIAAGATNTKEAARTAAKAEKLAAVATAALGQAQAEAELLKATAAQKPAAEAKRTAAQKALEAAKKAAENPGESYTPFRGAVKSRENNLETDVSRMKPFPDTSTGRRSAFAKWLTDPTNPLTARVAVNHVWLRHFGKPLVPTIFDFGRKGTPPTHPELLDWLAVELMNPSPDPSPKKGGESDPIPAPPSLAGKGAGGLGSPQPWSLKHLHRLIVTSNAYRLSSSALNCGENVKLDPENRFLWRMNPQRMQSQAVRDSLLHLAGDLDLTAGGPPVALAEQDTSRRRAMYFFHSHNEHHKFLDIFDDANVLECYRRSESIVPQQGLALWNSRFALTMAGKINDKLHARLGPAADDVAFAKAAFEMVLGTSPTADELTVCVETLAELRAALKDVKDPDRTKRARAQLMQALVNHNDFVTVR
ncbi:MAG: Planctomycete cytochrome [Gemmataceae bacterium]|nr:Planctomycete cytochrome [Gemmataceae bacterium]